MFRAAFFHLRLQPQGVNSVQPQGVNSVQPQGVNSIQPQGVNSVQPQGVNSVCSSIGLPFPSVHLWVGGGGGSTGFQFK